MTYNMTSTKKIYQGEFTDIKIHFYIYIKGGETSLRVTSRILYSATSLKENTKKNSIRLVLTQRIIFYCNN